MGRFVRLFLKSQLITSSIIVFLGANLGNFGNFLYNLFMARMLGPKDYGSLQAIISLSVLLGAPLAVISMLIVKLISSYWGKGEEKKIAYLLTALTKKSLFLGFIALLFSFLLAPLFASFLHLKTILPLIIIFVTVFLGIPLVITRSVLRGTLQFLALTLNGIIEVYLKLVVATGLVLFNFGLVGAILGFPTGALLAYFLTVFSLKNFFKGEKKEEGVFKNLSESFWPILLATLCFTSFYSTDLILVRHFFEAQTAGIYAALSVVGKIIIYASGPVVSVMFPLVTVRHVNGRNYLVPLLGTLVLVLGVALSLTFLYFLFPKFLVTCLFGERYLAIVPYLLLFSLFMVFYALNSVFTNFFLSISYYRPFPLLAFAAASQIFLIYLFHPSITAVIYDNIVASLLYFLICLYYFFKKEGQMVLSTLFRYVR